MKNLINYAILATLLAMIFGSDSAFARRKPRERRAVPKVEIIASGITPKIDDKTYFMRHAMPIPRLAVPGDTLTLFFMGDVMLHGAQIENSRARYASVHGLPDPKDHNGFDFSPYFSALRERIEKADIAVANMEFTLGGPPFEGYPSFSAPDSYPEYAADCGIDVFLLANNHILDKGREGAIRTLEMYREMEKRLGVRITGCFEDEESQHSGEPLIVEAQGLKVAFINFTYGTNADIAQEYPKVALTDKAQILNALNKAKDARADLIVVLPHWGIEYSLIHSARQQEIAEWLSQNGADIVIGSHPHVVQDTGAYIDADTGELTPVIYSLGNLISNMSRDDTQVGLLVTLKVVADRSSGVRLLEPLYTFTWCSLPGKFTNSHATIPIKDYVDRRSEWNDPSDYDRMMASYKRVKSIVGIND